MNTKNKHLGAAFLLAACCALPISAMAQDARHQQLAEKLAQMQVQSDGEMLSEQLLATASQPAVIHWSQRIAEEVPADKQEQVRDALEQELNKFNENSSKALAAQLNSTAQSTLVPIFMQELTADELQTVITYLESPASQKFQELGGPAANAWAQALVDETSAAVEKNMDAFEAQAEAALKPYATPAGK